MIKNKKIIPKVYLFLSKHNPIKKKMIINVKIKIRDSPNSYTFHIEAGKKLQKTYLTLIKKR
jgi:hypothetical protein